MSSRPEEGVQAMNVCQMHLKADPDWTILDQVAVAALETGDDALAEVLPPLKKWSDERVASFN